MKDFFICSSCGKGHDITQAAKQKKGYKGLRRLCNRCADGSIFSGAYVSYDPTIKISKAEAIERGHSAYWTGKACLNGHKAHRRVKDGACVKCNSDSVARYRAKKANLHGDQFKARKAVEDIIESRKLAKELDYL